MKRLILERKSEANGTLARSTRPVYEMKNKCGVNNVDSRKQKNLNYYTKTYGKQKQQQTFKDH